jgi:hypothetical protein
VMVPCRIRATRTEWYPQETDEMETARTEICVFIPICHGVMPLVGVDAKLAAR